MSDDSGSKRLRCLTTTSFHDAEAVWYGVGRFPAEHVEVSILMLVLGDFIKPSWWNDFQNKLVKQIYKQLEDDRRTLPRVERVDKPDPIVRQLRRVNEQIAEINGEEKILPSLAEAEVRITAAQQKENNN